MRCAYCSCDATGAVNVILFDQNRVEQSNPVIGTATAQDGVFLRQSHSWNGFPSVENSACGARNRFNVLGRYCRGGREHLQEIER